MVDLELHLQRRVPLASQAVRGLVDLGHVFLSPRVEPFLAKSASFRFGNHI